MRIHATARMLVRAASVSGFALASLLSIAAAPTTAEVSTHDSFLAIQKQVESIEPALVKSTVVIRLPDGSGSGVIISPDGLVLTAGHVVEGREGRRVTVVLFDGRSMQATVIGSNRDSDLGLVRVSDASGLPAAPLGDSSTLRRGEWILATGHPLGQHEGRPPVLRIGRILRVGNRYGRDTRSVTTDAPIISGDSGGPLFDLTGHVVGINSMITTGQQRQTSIHIPVNMAKSAVARCLHGEPPDSWEGPPAALLTDLRDAQAALQSGDASAATRIARDAIEADQTSAAARMVLAHSEARSGHAQLALAAISQACDRGFNDPEAIRMDSDFAALRKEPALERILERLDAYNGIPGDRKTDTAMFLTGAPRDLRGAAVRILSGGSDVALGTVMSVDGDILTKASELPEGPLTCVGPDGQTAALARAGTDPAWDVALLKTNAGGLKLLPTAEAGSVGEWTFSPDASGSLAALGMVGVLDMPVHGQG
ncbi:MAG TPA: trypsin-like peptidase domain-containing protein, partial [Chthonomonadaceae bacterium]|nr:trypsin-like peptidase domain-containing protein [Chthonomonadaceae bacterium]